MEDKNLARIAALLRKAERTDNEHEADAYLQAAQRLATLASIDMAVVRAHSTQPERRATPVQRVITIGDAGKRGLRTYVHLFVAIARPNDVLCDVARDSTSVYAYGFASDIDAVEALYASLVVQMVRSSDMFLKSGRYAEELVPRTVRQVVTTAGGRRARVRYVEELRPVHASTARLNFQQAFAARIAQRLQDARDGARAEAVSHSAVAGDEALAGRGTATGVTGVEIVLRQREVELLDHYRRHSTARGTWQGTRATAGFSAESRRAGDAAGSAARLTAQHSIGGSRAALSS